MTDKRPPPTTVRISPPVRIFIAKMAKKQGCSISFKIAQILEEYKEAEERKLRPEGETREILR